MNEQWCKREDPMCNREGCDAGCRRKAVPVNTGIVRPLMATQIYGVQHASYTEWLEFRFGSARDER